MLSASFTESVGDQTRPALKVGTLDETAVSEESRNCSRDPALAAFSTGTKLEIGSGHGESLEYSAIGDQVGCSPIQLRIYFDTVS